MSLEILSDGLPPCADSCGRKIMEDDRILVWSTSEMKLSACSAALLKGDDSLLMNPARCMKDVKTLCQCTGQFEAIA